MSEIIKTEAVVLTKINYSESSNIVSLFTKDYGRISAIVKGGRRPNSKISLIVDPPNYVNVIFYKKESREIQVITGADIVNHYPKLKSDLEKIKYAYAIIELVKNLTPEHEANIKLFRGVIRIFSLFDSSNQPAKIVFGRFFLFFLSVIGYEIQIESCSVCGKSNLEEEQLSYNFENGILCEDCKSNYIEFFGIDRELFNLLKCLKNNIPIQNYDESILNRAILFMERYLKYQVSDFKGLQSLKIFEI